MKFARVEFNYPTFILKKKKKNDALDDSFYHQWE